MIFCTEIFSTIEFVGTGTHKENGACLISIIDKGSNIKTLAFSHKKYKRTGIYSREGEKYKFEVVDNQIWWDARIDCDANGWDRANLKLGLKEIAIAGMELFYGILRQIGIVSLGVLVRIIKQPLKLGESNISEVKKSG